MKFFKNTRLLLILILLLAALLRIPYLGELPLGLTIDEAGQGYSAYSILKTGKDEWGDFLPLNPRGFGDYKPPLFMYLLVPSIAVFGLSEFSVRLPSAIAGILTVWIIYFLAKNLLQSKNLGLTASFFMAIAPWHVYSSRLGWESNTGLMFFCLGIWLFLKSIKIKRWIIFSIAGFGLSALSYHSFKLISPLMFIVMLAIFWKQIKLDRKIMTLSGIAGLIFVIILGYGFIFSGASRRVQDQTILKEENLAQLREAQFDDRLPQPLNRVLNNKYAFFTSKMTDNYIGYFSFPFLFGPHRSNGSVLNFPTQGLLYIWQLPIILLGIFYLIKNFTNSSKLIFAWFFIAPIPASITWDYMHAGRSQAIFPILTIISVVGLNYLLQLVKNARYKLWVIYAISVLITVSLILRIDNYFFHTFNKPHGGLVQGYDEIVKYTQETRGKYNKIIFTKSNSEPQAFIAFYTKWNPSDFQKQSKEWKSFEEKGFRYLDMTDYNLGKYEFKKVDLSRDRNEQNALIIGTEEEILPFINPAFTVKDATGKTVFIAVQSNEIPE